MQGVRWVHLPSPHCLRASHLVHHFSLIVTGLTKTRIGGDAAYASADFRGLRAQFISVKLFVSAFSVGFSCPLVPWDRPRTVRVMCLRYSLAVEMLEAVVHVIVLQ